MPISEPLGRRVVFTNVDETPLFANLKMTDIPFWGSCAARIHPVWVRIAGLQTARIIDLELDLTTTEFDVLFADCTLRMRPIRRNRRTSPATCR